MKHPPDQPRGRSAAAPLTGLLILLVIAALAVGSLRGNWVRIPPNFFPWDPVELDARPGWFAHIQLNGLESDGPACRAALSRSKVRFVPLADRRIDDACAYLNVVRVERSPIVFNYTLTASCGLTAALDWYEQRLNELAARDLHTSVTRIDQLGTFACRNVDWQSAGPRSQHATANAIDIAAFHLANGRTVSVADDYGKASPQGRYLDDAHDAACAYFNTVLGPRYNRLHSTHFHLDMGPYRICD